ncbi:MAG TPA: DUF262 domain-containing protein, partial [Bellilinea sp.]|nr:DUF262 domain-containing protein [Bellilinea sp.]
MILPPEKLRLGDLLHQRIPFKVPKYQRTFAWEQPEIEDFAKDLRALYRARSEGRQHLHFFGGLVSVERDAPGTISGRIFEVVDGQQRLTSFILTISLLVDSFLELKQEAEASGNLEVARNSEQYANDTRDSYLYYHELITNERFLRMMLSAADNDFFVDLIEKRDPRPVRQSHHRLVDALDCLRGDLISHVVQPEPSLPALEVAEKFTRLQQLRMSILEDCYVILIKSDNRNEAYRLFAVLNDRGKTLSDGDLLRSHTLEILEGFEAHQERVEKCWDEILDHKGDEINSFLRPYSPSHQGDRSPSRDLADSYRESFFPFDPPVSLTPSQATDIVQRVRNLDDESQTYFDLVAGRWPYPEPGVSQWDRDRLKRLILVLKHTLCLPLLLSAARLLPENMFAELVHLMERFSFRYITIVGAHPTRLANCYYSNAKAIRENP